MPTFYKKTTRTIPLSRAKRFVRRAATSRSASAPTLRRKARLHDEDEDTRLSPPSLQPQVVRSQHDDAEQERDRDFQPEQPVASAHRVSGKRNFNDLENMLHGNAGKKSHDDVKPRARITPSFAHDFDEDDNAIFVDEEDTHENVVHSEPPAEVDDFDGISDEEEQKELYTEAIDYERKKAKAVAEELRLIAEERERERRALEKEIKALKQELHGAVTVHDNKFMELSKQLQNAIFELHKIAHEGGVPILDQSVISPATQIASPMPVMVAPQPTSVNQPTVVIQQPVVQPVVQTTAPPQPVVATPVVEPPQPNDTLSAPKDKKTLSKKKTLITGAAAVAVLVILSGVVVKSMTSKPAVDEKLVAQYLQQQGGQVQGAQTQAPAGQDSAAPVVAPASTEDPSQSSVTFEQSVWEEFKDPAFGITLQYPKNAVKAIRTESNVTFIRKTGYLFKVQRVETALTVDEYWKQIKATSLNYDVTEEKFKGKPALALKLEDVADYPGNRILVKEGNFIYDVWYATPSNNFPKDDILRAEKMLASLSIVEAK